jgi:hypothetical protein
MPQGEFFNHKTMSKDGATFDLPADVGNRVSKMICPD